MYKDVEDDLGESLLLDGKMLVLQKLYFAQTAIFPIKILQLKILFWPEYPEIKEL